MRKTISKHKTTITGAITLVLCIGATIRWFIGQIDATELMVFIGTINTIAITLIGAFGKDGSLKKGNEDV